MRHYEGMSSATPPSGGVSRWTTAFGTGIPGSRSANSPDRRLPRGRHDLPREFVARTQRDRLIDAMASTVARKGYVGTSLGDVCAAAGVSTRAYYQHFADKETCFLAAYERGVELLQGSVAVAYGQPGQWPERMRRGLGTLLHILAAEPAFAALSVVEVLAAAPRRSPAGACCSPATLASSRPRRARRGSRRYRGWRSRR
ncbi:TetR/AcrR family transcriptional regulator [Phytohabitans flavus]|uniref:TetR/AcrR family transcriptional regulator n=1 Tax=Phytohabitans flavus TaxID=1076124 RepID=UPI003640D87E